jgi:hypothetical protein
LKTNFSELVKTTRQSLGVDNKTGQSSEKIIYEPIKMWLLAKLKREISGTGYECRFEKITGFYYTGIFGGRDPPKFIYEHVKLSKSECEEMVKSKKCKESDKQMSCE